MKSLAESTSKWVADNEKTSYREWLEQSMPFVPVPVDVPNYKADQGRRYRPSDDLVDVRSEVDAFAYLLASRGLDPPLAVGLFGDWGSGKTFFMDALRHRINQLTTSQRVLDMPQGQIPFWKHIVQVEFNAWNYVEGELLASLVEEIFSQLRLASDGESDEAAARLAQRQRHWLEKLESSRLALERIQTERRESELRLEAERHRAEQLRGRYETEVAELERLRARRVSEVLLTEHGADVVDALKPVTATLGGPAASDALDALNEAREELSRGRALLAPIVDDRRTVIRLVGGLVLTTLIVWGLSSLDVASVVPIFGGLASAVGLAVPVLRSFTSWLRGQLDKVENAQQLVAGEIRAASDALETEIAQAEARARTTEEALRGVTDAEDELVAELARINNELKKTPTQLLGEFIGERVGSSDYRKRLGVPALIRHDFDMLSRLIREQNTSMGPEEASVDSNIVNRIILYIDDLDRCPEGKVIEVLQAVHLLLAFELFVVVVAVDSRWLADALTRHFPALGSSSGVENPASPDDYLEKIFQIPFWVRPLSPDDRMHVVRGLLEGHIIAGDRSGHNGGTEASIEIGSQHEKVLESLDSSTAPPSLEAAALTITRDELAFLDQLAPLMGKTPRSVKRFVNLYQLVKVLRRTAVPQGPNQPSANPSNDQIAVMMLAIGDGLPLLAQGLVQALATSQAGTLKQMVDTVALPPGSVERDQMNDWLESRPNWQIVPGTRLAECIPLIERFLFRVGGATTGAAV